MQITRIKQQFVDLLESIENQASATWEVLRLQELVNELRGLGNSVSTSTVISIAEECYTAYKDLPKWPEVSYMETVKLTVALVDKYVERLLEE